MIACHSLGIKTGCEIATGTYSCLKLCSTIQSYFSQNFDSINHCFGKLVANFDFYFQSFGS